MEWKTSKSEWFAAYFGRLDHERGAFNRGKSKEAASVVVADATLLDLHVSHSVGLEHGPIIERRGDFPPIMEDPQDPGADTTDPELQRIGSYFILEKQRKERVRDACYLLAGNYIILGSLSGSPGERAVEAAATTLLSYFGPGFGRFPAPRCLEPRDSGARNTFNPGTFGEDMLDFGRMVSNFFRNSPLGNEIAEILNSSLEGGDGHDAVRSMNWLYRKTFPGFLNNVDTTLASPLFQRAVEINVRKYLRLLIQMIKTPSHEEKARASSPSKPIALMQGCGDLTMNEWNVAFLSGPSCNGKQPWCLLHPPGEPLNDRSYTCLIKWSCEKTDDRLLEIARKSRVVYPYQIARVRFKAPSLDAPGTLSSSPDSGPPDPSEHPDRHVFLCHNSDMRRSAAQYPIGHLIEFAVYGQQVYRDGQPVKSRSLIQEFGDIRHVFKLPNLNQEREYSMSDSGFVEYSKQPRNLFNQRTYDAVWLGEAALIQGDRNLRVTALQQPVQLDLRDLGAPREWIEAVLQGERESIEGPLGRALSPAEEKLVYRKVESEVQEPGQWRWVVEGRSTWLEIYFLKNQYPCTMIGLKAADEGADESESEEAGPRDCREIAFLAHGYGYNWKGCTIEEAADYLHREQGSWNILLMDEGHDVFQLLPDPDSGELSNRIGSEGKLIRTELRCVFWGGENKEEEMR